MPPVSSIFLADNRTDHVKDFDPAKDILFLSGFSPDLSSLELTEHRSGRVFLSYEAATGTETVVLGSWAQPVEVEDIQLDLNVLLVSADRPCRL